MLKFSLLHPQRGLSLLEAAQQVKNNSLYKHEYTSTHSKFEDAIVSLFPDSANKLVDLKNETYQLQAKLKKFFEKLEGERFPSNKKPYPVEYSLNDSSGIFLYVLCRLFKPEKVVETGVAYGNSSAFILQALNENKKGQLYSIDFVFRPWETKESIGAVIPSELRERWHLIFGPTKKKLKKTLVDLDKVDIFFHDSLHAHKNMTFEFNTAWQHIENGGFLLSDDISDNSAFYEFYSSSRLNPIIIGENKQSLFGILQKPS